MWPSAQPGVDIPELLHLIVKEEIYRDDYEALTLKLLEERIPYDEAISAINKIADSGMFSE